MYYRALQDNWDNLYKFLPAKWVAVENEAEAEVIIRQRAIKWHERNRKKSGAVVDRLWYGLLRSEWETA